MRQFTQHILPLSMGLDPTKVWSYGAAGDAATFNYPAFTIEADYGKPVRVKWINDLVDGSGQVPGPTFSGWIRPSTGPIRPAHPTWRS